MVEVEEPGVPAGMSTPRPIGSRSLGEFRLDVVRIECQRCDRLPRTGSLVFACRGEEAIENFLHLPHPSDVIGCPGGRLESGH